MDEHKIQPGQGEARCYAFPNKPTPSMPVVIDETKCTGCNKCVTICTTDVLVANPEKGKPPIIMYPEECWYAGCCVGECPVPGALTMRHPLMMRVHYKNKETGEINRV
ncbi:MAG: ferredoxin family protein [Syntrophorhabdaceae bacterium]|nr:ferredoxin family protein [Syntrophorhabdaceae bacterium]